MRGHITQRTKGSWTIRVELPRDPQTGKRRQKTVTLNGTKKAAEARLAQMLVEAESGQVHVDVENMTVEQYLERWLESTEGQIRDNTFDSYVKAVKAFSPLIGHINLRKLTTLDVQVAVNKLQKSGRVRPSTVRLYLIKLRVALEQAVDWDFIHKNPARKVKSAKFDKPETQFWTEEEAKVFLKNTATGYRYYPMWLLDLRSGLREGEIVGLEWLDINLDKGLVTVRRTVTAFGVNDPKSAAGKRVVPIDPETIKVMKKHRKAMMEECLRRGEKWDEKRRVFLTSRGKSMTGKHCLIYFTRAIQKVAATNDLKRITFHGLRHTYATILLSRGVNIKKVAKVLGHADVTTLLNTYAHVLPEDDDQVIEAISQAFAES